MKKISVAILAFVVLCCGFSFPSGAVNVSAKTSVLIDASSNKVLYEKDSEKKIPMASTTKIMSTILVLESGNLDEYFKVDSNAIKVEGSSMGLLEGDMVSKRVLCYGMMLPSGNDAANAAACRVAGSVEKFVDMMNAKAQELGLKNTHFVTPSGLDDYTDEHYSTAYDMAVLTSYALQNSEFLKICSCKNAKVSFGNPPYDRWLVNSNKLLGSCEGVIGVKTGFTDKAKRCLVSACERKGTTLICVTLNDPNDWQDHRDLYDFGFSQYSEVKLNALVKEYNVSVVGGQKDTVRASAGDFKTVSILTDDKDRIRQCVVLNRINYSPIVKDEKLGEVLFYLDGKCIAEIDIRADEPVAEYESGSREKIKFINKIRRFFMI